MDLGNQKDAHLLTDSIKVSGWHQQAVKFALVGILNTALDWGVYLLLTQVFGAAPIFAKAGSYSTGVLNSYFLNRSWTFHSGANFSRAFLPFLGINLAGLLINSGCMYLAVYILNLDEIPGLIFASAATFAWNYIASRRFVFRT